MTHVLITHGTTPFAQRVARQFPATYRITFGVAEQLPEALMRTGKYKQIPAGKVPDFAHALLNLCLDMDISTLLPLGRAEILPLARAAQLFAEYQIEVLLPPLLLLETIPVYVNPVKEALPVVLVRGHDVRTETDFMPDFPYSGVYLQADDGETPALCCVDETEQ